MLNISNMLNERKSEINGMNILYCGDQDVQDGLLISILSLLKHVSDELHIYIMTMELHTAKKDYHAISASTVAFLNQTVQQQNSANFVKSFDCTSMFVHQLPRKNMSTRFTPYAMLRLFADRLDLPERLLYLDSDVVCHRDPTKFYHQDIQDIEFVGVLDYYGRWFFHRSLTHLDYVNSGVLLLNMKMIKQTKLFERARKRCIDRWMFMPDQSALNKLSQSKRIVSRKYNEQHQLHTDTVFQHFTTSFKFFPLFKIQTIKPWEINQVHQILGIHAYDDILNQYQHLAPELVKSK